MLNTTLHFKLRKNCDCDPYGLSYAFLYCIWCLAGITTIKSVRIPWLRVESFTWWNDLKADLLCLAQIQIQGSSDSQCCLHELLYLDFQDTYKPVLIVFTSSYLMRKCCRLAWLYDLTHEYWAWFTSFPQSEIAWVSKNKFKNCQTAISPCTTSRCADLQSKIV